MGGPETMMIDEILDLLSHSYRREILRILRDHDDNVVPFDAMHTALAGMETEHSRDSADEDQILPLFFHHHGAKLREAGLIDYDVRSEEIRYHPNERVETALETVEELEEML